MTPAPEAQKTNEAGIAADLTRTGYGHRRFAYPKERLYRPALAPASGPVRRLVGCWAPFLPAWRFRGRSIRGGPALHLVRFRPCGFSLSIHAEPELTGQTDVVPSRLFHTPRVNLAIVAIPLASKPRGFRHRVDPFRPFLLRSSLAAFPGSVRSSRLDERKVRPRGESHKLCKPDLSTGGGFCGG